MPDYNGKIAVKYNISPEVKGFSDGDFNIMFFSGVRQKYYAKITWPQRQCIIWEYENFIIQSKEFKMWALSGSIGFALGFFSKMWFGC